MAGGVILRPTAALPQQPEELYAGPLRRPKDLLRALIVAAVIMNVSRIHQHYGWLGAMRPGLITVALATGLAFMTPRFFDGAPGPTATSFHPDPTTKFLALPYAADLTRDYVAIKHNTDRQVVASVASALARNGGA